MGLNSIISILLIVSFFDLKLWMLFLYNVIENIIIIIAALMHDEQSYFFTLVIITQLKY